MRAENINPTATSNYFSYLIYYSNTQYQPINIQLFGSPNNVFTVQAQFSNPYDSTIHTTSQQVNWADGRYHVITASIGFLNSYLGNNLGTLTVDGVTTTVSIGYNPYGTGGNPINGVQIPQLLMPAASNNGGASPTFYVDYLQWLGLPHASSGYSLPLAPILIYNGDGTYSSGTQTLTFTSNDLGGPFTVGGMSCASITPSFNDPSLSTTVTQIQTYYVVKTISLPQATDPTIAIVNQMAIFSAKLLFILAFLIAAEKLVHEIGRGNPPAIAYILVFIGVVGAASVFILDTWIGVLAIVFALLGFRLARGGEASE